MSLAARALIALALVGAGYWWGHTATDNAWAARQARQERATAQALAQEARRADQAAALYLTEHLDQETRYAELDSQYRALRKRTPLLVPAAAALRTGACASAPAPQPTGPPAADPGAGPGLTLAAVRMWNGALAGADAPAGACGAAGTAPGADAACAQDSGLTLDDAWDNHRANAKSCLEDRRRYQALIDFLNHRDPP